MQLFSYWQGPVTWVERLSVATAISQRNNIMIFTSDVRHLKDSGLGGDIINVAEVFDDPSLARLKAKHPAHYTDHLRLSGLLNGFGTWADLDLIHLKLMPGGEYIYGMENDIIANNAVLRLPSDSAVLQEYWEYCGRRPIKMNESWMPLSERIHRHYKRVLRMARGSSAPTPALGPRTLTHFLRKYNLMDLAKRREVFYPMGSGKEIANVATPGWLESIIKPETVTLHMYMSGYRKRFALDAPPPGTMLERMVRELDLQRAA